METLEDDRPDAPSASSPRPPNAQDIDDTVPSQSLPRTPESINTRRSEQSSTAGLTSSASSLSLSLSELDTEEPTSVRIAQEGMRLPPDVTRVTATSRRLWAAYEDNYLYNLLPANQVRLLIIKPGASDDPLNVCLLPLNDELLGTQKYPYKALSYHWGPGKEDKEIIIQDDPTSEPVNDWSDVIKRLGRGRKDRKKLVKPNLYAALKHLRHKEKPVSAWVDALCINQKDIEEKSHQISKMPTIYRNAYDVVIWLGSDTDDNSSSATAMKFITSVIDPNKHEELLNDDNMIPQWASIFELLQWSWFSRRWIIQELALAKKATVHCGSNKSIHWHDFQDAIAIFYRDFDVLKPKLRKHFETTSGPNQGRWDTDSEFEIEQLGAKKLVDITSNLFRKTGNGSSSTYGLETLVCLLTAFDTSDPRDTINALINISSEFGRDDPDLALAVPLPDYNKSLFQVYRDFVKWVVTTSKSLDILCRHWAIPEREQDQSMASQLVNLPSWILSVDDSPFGRGDEVFEGRRAGESLVGLPLQSHYHASGRGYWKKDLNVRWPTDPDSKTAGEDSVNIARLTSIPPALPDMAITVTGLAIGEVSFRTEPFPDGVITKSCLERLGWSFPRRATEVRRVPDRLWQTLVADRGPNGLPIQPIYRRACQHVLVNLTKNGHINIDNLLRSNDNPRRRIAGYTKDYLERVRSVTWDRSFIEGQPILTDNSAQSGGTSEKLVGLAPPKTMENDIIAILYGCSVPVILRPTYDYEHELEGYQFVGEAFIYGKMDGEAIRGGYKETEFRLI